MYYLLINPLSKSGSNPKQVKKVHKFFAKKGIETEDRDIITISKNVDSYVNSLKEEDVVVIVGGDGTLHYFSNVVRNIQKKNRIFLYKGGTGNDFSREFKGNLIEITDIIRDVPTFDVGNGPETFLNCTGFGIDGDVCNMVNGDAKSKKGINYFKSAVHLFKNFKQFDVDATVDGVEYRFKKVWFVTVMNGKNFGGGMKLSPKSNRFDDEMELCMVHSVNLFVLLLIFPLIFIGKHMWFKKVGIECIKGKEFKLVASTPQTLQSDGEVTIGVKEFTCKR